MPKKTQYARVMHHIGGLSPNNDNSEMIRGGEDELNLITEDAVAGLSEQQQRRLFEIGALREATPDEVKRFEIAKGIREADPDDEEFVNFTTGSEGVKPGEGGAAVSEGTQAGKGAAGQQQGNPSGQQSGSAAGAPDTFKGMGKGELSEYTVPELKEMAKEAGVEGYAEMKKDELLDALLASGN